MSKKNETRVCWNCDGNAPFHFSSCPYCGVVLEKGLKPAPFSFQEEKTPFQKIANQEASPPPSPYNFNVSQEEWNKTVEATHEESEPEGKNEIVAFLLLLPGIVFLLFACALLFFSQEGSLTLRWNQNFAYFYLIGAVPLIILGWKSLR